MKKNIFIELTKYYSKQMAYACLSGERTPGLRAIILIEESLKVPPKAWLDIKSYLKNNTTTQTKQSTPTKNEEVA